MPKLFIDGKEVEFTQGETIIQASNRAGNEIPHFCWHPSLSVSGNCRVCLVEVEKMPKLMIACATQAAEGMVVHTQSDRAIEARQAVMEFILINHPLDCPICDEAGECKLQDYAYKHSQGESRFTENKNHKQKHVELGPNVMFDGERCISCSRCIRFCDEIAGTKQLTFAKRGDKVTITTFPGKQLDNPYSMNVVDICPVGALTNKDFRFQARVWDMSPNNTICSGCSRGCNIEMWVKGNKIMRLTPRFNEQVNSHWMCDNGRLNTFEFVNSDERLEAPYIRREGQLTKVTWSEAIAAAVSELKTYRGSEIAVIGSPSNTCEDNYLLAKVAKTILDTKNIGIPSYVKKGSSDKLLVTEDKSPNALGTKLVGLSNGDGGLDYNGIIDGVKSGKIKALYVVDEDLISLDPSLEEYLAKLDTLVVHSTTKNKTSNLATIVLPGSTYAEKNGTWVNVDGIAQRLKPAITTTEIDRSLDGLVLSRLDKFGTKYDRWGNNRELDARPTWKIMTEFAYAFGHKWKFKMAEDVFTDLSKHVKEFAGLDYDVIGDKGIKLKVSQTIKA